MNEGFEKIKQRFNEDPVTMIFVSGIALGGLAKLIDALSAAKGRRAYAKQVDYRVRKGR